MRFPLKLNQSYWPKALTRRLPSNQDPRILLSSSIDPPSFSRAVSVFKIGSTFKSTRKARFPETLKALQHLPFEHPPVVLDVGASDGSTSIDAMKALAFCRYYVTDLNVEIYWETEEETSWFFDDSGRNILAATDKWLFYPETVGAVWPFGRLCDEKFRHAPKSNAMRQKLVLVNPLVSSTRDNRVSVLKYDIFTPWQGEKADIVIAANVLNRVYFSDENLRTALAHLLAALRNNGRIVIVDNRPEERASIVKHENENFKIECRIAGGSDIEGLAIQVASERVSRMPPSNQRAE